MRLSMLLIAFFITSSCNNALLNEKIQGNWVLSEALRNGRLTSTFENCYFNFDKDQNIETNFTGEVVRSKYKIKGKIIKSDNTLPEIIVNSCSKDSLALSCNIENNDLQFNLVRY